MGTLGEVGNIDPSLDYITCSSPMCSRAIPKEELQLLWVWQPRSPGERLLPRNWGKLQGKVGLNFKGGDGKEGRLSPLRSWWLPNRPPLDDALTSMKTCLGKLPS